MRRAPLLLILLAAGTALFVAPALAVEPSGKPDKPAKADRPPETPVTLSGVVAVARDADGDTRYTLSSGGTTWTLDVGPTWWYGNAHPLAPLVGRSVSIRGTTRAGETEVDVNAIDGTVVREPGRPPWAGGPKVVGERHPGFKPWKAERAAWKSAWFALKLSGERALGRAGAPGHVKPKPSPSAGT